MSDFLTLVLFCHDRRHPYSQKVSNEILEVQEALVHDLKQS